MGLSIIRGDGKVLKPKCVVTIDNVVSTYTDFVVVGFDGGNVALSQNADVMTLAVALELVKKAFCESYAGLNAKDKELVDDFFAKGGKA